MLTEGWDVKNVFQIVPHESRAFESKLLIAQVLGRGLRVPSVLSEQPYLTINNHEAWSANVANLLQEVLEVENSLSWSYDSNRSKHVWVVHNLSYEPQQTTTETKQKKATDLTVSFLPQERVTREESRFSETGTLAIEITHDDVLELDSAIRLLRLFLREKSSELADAWSPDRLEKFIQKRLRAAGQDTTFLSQENFILLQQAFGPLLREPGGSHPRLGQVEKDLFEIDLSACPRQHFTESSLRNHGHVWYSEDNPAPFENHEAQLWSQYLQLSKMLEEYGDLASEDAKQIGPRIRMVAAKEYRSPWTVHYVTHEPERKFSELLFSNADLFEAFVKMPDKGLYSFPYSYKPAGTARTHVANEQFNPDFFLRLSDSDEVLVVEIKADDDDSHRNRAKCRDGEKHFARLNDRLESAGEPSRYHFYFLSPDDYSSFFTNVRAGSHVGWRSGLMQQLMPA
jgi:type III restriction enzyme